ncbi:MAG: winged helix-turn-helix domain-containing protein [archaeon]
MNEEQLKAICDPTRFRILGLLTQEPLSNTELFKKLDKRRLGKGIGNRESIFKSLKKLLNAGLVTRVLDEERRYVYSASFKELKIEGNLFLRRK